jgi:hypothetical protein
MIIGSHPLSILTCISSCYICIPNIIWIHLTITEKMNGKCHYQECDGWTSPYHMSCLQQVYKSKNKLKLFKISFSRTSWLISILLQTILG